MVAAVKILSLTKQKLATNESIDKVGVKNVIPKSAMS